MDKTKVNIDYKLQVTTTPTGEQYMVPAITNRKASLDLTDVVKNAIKCCRIAAIKNEAVEPIAVALAEEIYDALKNGEAVNFDGYFAVAPYLDGTTDANGQLTDENLMNARLHKGEKFKLNLKDFSWHLEGSELDPSIVRLANASDGAKTEITAGEMLSIVGTNLAEVNPGDDYASAVNNNLPHKYKLAIERNGEKAEREIAGISFKKARTLLRAAAIAERRRRCHAENIGYISVDAFDEDAAGRIADELFAEGEGRGALVVDARNNIGGHTADKLIEMLCTKRHDRAKMRGVEGEGFVYSRLGRPVFPDLPVVAIINSKSVSNAEEFAHAMRTFERGRLVGEETAGMVIGTTTHPLFDYGTVNRPSIGFFLPDGTDMEWHGAEPDVEVKTTPADFAAGRDPQLDAAIEEAKKLAKKNAKRELPEPKFSR